MFRRLFHFSVLLGMLASLLAVSPISSVRAAATLTVCPSGCDYATIKLAVAGAALTGDTLNVSAGTYNEHDIFIDKDLTIQGAGSASTIVDAATLGQVFSIGNLRTVSINGMTIQNGQVVDLDGGGIFNNGTLSMNDVIIDNNEAKKVSATYLFGGGIYNLQSLTMTNSRISNNKANYGGGGIYSYFNATTTLTNVSIDNNSVVASGGTGGGLEFRNQSTANVVKVTLDQVSVTNNTVNGTGSEGAGIISDAGMNISNSLIANNTGADYGGGLNFYDGGGGATAITVSLANVTITGNSATADGGGIHSGLTLVSSDINLNNVTVANNTASNNGGGLYVNKLNIRNSIFADNIATTSDPDCSGTINSQDYNLIGDTTGCTINGTTTHNVAGPSLLNTLANNGGATQTLSLQTGSPAIDAGDNNTCEATDARGRTRPQGVHCDIGAYEAPVIVTFRSVGLNDGWILESTETSGVGGTLNSTATTFNLGDGTKDKQYRSILHFNTTTLPDNAQIVCATLNIKKQGTLGTDPFTILGSLNASMRKPSFGTAALELKDFKSTAGKNNVATFSNGLLPNWYSAELTPTGNLYVNRTGITQFRLSFTTDDNNDNGNDFMKFFSGNAPIGNQPQLVIYYYTP